MNAASRPFLRGPAQRARNASIAAEERALANYSHSQYPQHVETRFCYCQRCQWTSHLAAVASVQPEHRIGGWLARMAEGLLPASDLTNHSEPVL